MKNAEKLQAKKIDLNALTRNIKAWGVALGFQQIGIADTELSHEAAHLQQWLAQGFHGEMDYMARGAANRASPAAMVPGTVRAITARLNYVAPSARDAEEVMADSRAAFISRYALGRDYHKVLRQKLQALAMQIHDAVGEDFQYRVFTDSAPVMEVALATKSGIGWRGKHTLLLNRDAGSMYFLGEIYVNLPLPVDAPVSEHCGSCTKCIDVCPTQAIVAPYQLDARRCISYLTIENKGAIPVEFRAAIGNRIYGCDDCQLVCPWNKYAQLSVEKDFTIRHRLDDISLAELWSWTEDEWLTRMEGSAIRRIGYARWQRNLAVAMGNALRDTSLAHVEKQAISNALHTALDDRNTDALVREHIVWALREE